MKKRYFCLSIILIAVLFFSCADDSSQISPENGVQNVGGNENEVYTTIPSVASPNLEPKDMGGRTFNIMTVGWFGHAPLDITDITTEELTGESLNDAVYNRILYLEDKYNIIINEINHPDHNAAAERIGRFVMADDPAYDLCFIRSTNFINLVTNRFILDLAEIPIIDISKPWWDSNSYDALSLFGRHYAICSDMTMNDYLAIWAIYFNKDMIQNYGLDDPYALVESGQWTYDRLFDMGRQVTRDLNGDGIMNRHDLFGIHHSNDTVTGMLNCIGINFGGIDSNGYPEFTLDRPENITRMLSLLERLFDQEQVYNFHSRGEGQGEVCMFSRGQVLFNFSAIHMAPMLRMMEQDFGILPYPKYDENQPNYISSASPLFLTLAVVPITNRDLESTGMIMEDMAYQGYRTIRPAFYDLLLQGRIARDEESLVMLDYLFDNVQYDVGGLLNIGNFSWDFAVTIPNNYDLNITSFIERQRGRIDSSIDAIIEALR